MRTGLWEGEASTHGGNRVLMWILEQENAITKIVQEKDQTGFYTQHVLEVTGTVL